MRLNSWVWLIAGVIISVMSGYVYLTIPKNGQPNTAMALFFFVGIIFLVVGITKLFFKRIDDQSVMDSIKTVEQPQPKIITMPNNVSNTDSRPNRVDETIAQLMQQEQRSTPQTKPQAPIPTGTSAQNASKEHHTGHTNSFSKLYEYKGPVHAPASGAHAQHPVTQHTQSSTHTPQHPIQNTTQHSIKCKKCGNANTGSSNYCHQCGNRLK